MPARPLWQGLWQPPSCGRCSTDWGQCLSLCDMRAPGSRKEAAISATHWGSYTCALAQAAELAAEPRGKPHVLVSKLPGKAGGIGIVWQTRERVPAPLAPVRTTSHR